MYRRRTYQISLETAELSNEDFQQSLKELEIKVVATTRLGDNGYCVVDYQGSIDSIVEMLNHYWDITWGEFFIMMHEDKLELTEVNK